MRDIWDDMTRWLDRGHDFAVARVVNTWGSEGVYPILLSCKIEYTKPLQEDPRQELRHGF